MKVGLLFKALDFRMVGIYHLVIRRFIVVKNRSQGVIIHLPVGKINVIYTYIYNIYIYIYIYTYIITISTLQWDHATELRYANFPLFSC